MQDIAVTTFHMQCVIPCSADTLHGYIMLSWRCVLCSGMYGRQQAGLCCGEEAGEAAHKEADDWLCGYHGQEGGQSRAMSMFHSTMTCRPGCKQPPKIRSEGQLRGSAVVGNCISLLGCTWVEQVLWLELLLHGKSFPMPSTV